MSQESKQDTDQLDRVLAALDPACEGRLTTSGIDGALEAIGDAIVTYRRDAPLRRRSWRLTGARRVIAVAAALTLLAGVATAATTLFIPTQTHIKTPRWAIPGAGPGQRLNADGTDFRQVALALSAETPYPDGYASWRDYVIKVERPPYGGVPSGQVRGAFAMSAICAWVLDWRNATQNGDRVRAVHDAAVLAGAVRWRAVTAWDPHPRVSVPGDSGTTHPSTFGWAIPYIAAVRAHDPARLDRLLANIRYNASFYLYDPGFNAWLSHQTSAVNNSRKALLRYLVEHPAS
jgi:hypothetical protein